MAKHNKKRNTAFLYEALVHELAASVVRKDPAYKRSLVVLIKEHFSRGTILYDELDLYRSVYEVTDISESIAHRLIEESQRSYRKIDKKTLFNAQTNLISEINKLNPGIFSNFIKHYKVLASLRQVLCESKLKVADRVFLKEYLVDYMTTPPPQKESKAPQSVDKLTYKTFVEKFNKKYGSTLNENQKELLGGFIYSAVTDNLEFKIYLNKEVGRLKESVFESLELQEVKSDFEMVQKTNKVLQLLQEMKNRKIDQDLISDILNIQSLVQEFQN